MKGSTKAGVLLPAIKQTGQTLALFGVLALFGLVGAGMSHTALTLNGVRIAASVGDVHIGNGGG